MLKQCPDLNADFTDSDTESENELTIEDNNVKKCKSQDPIIITSNTSTNTTATTSNKTTITEREFETKVTGGTIKKVKYENCSFTLCNNKLKVQMNIVLLTKDKQEKEEEVSVNNQVSTAAISKVDEESDTTSGDTIEIILTEDESEEE
ncbi:hypothetical protein ABK040_007737 [Willaertia magna]